VSEVGVPEAGVLAAGAAGLGAGAGAGAAFGVSRLGAGLAGALAFGEDFFLDGLAERLAASRSIVPITFSPGVLGESSAVGVTVELLLGGVSGGDCLATTGAASGAGVFAGVLGAVVGGGGGGGVDLAIGEGGGGGSVRPGAGGGGGGGGGVAVGRVLNSNLSAFFLSCNALANASRTTFSMSALSLAVGLFSTSKPFSDRCSTIVEVPRSAAAGRFRKTLNSRDFSPFQHRAKGKGSPNNFRERCKDKINPAT